MISHIIGHVGCFCSLTEQVLCHVVAFLLNVLCIYWWFFPTPTT